MASKNSKRKRRARNLRWHEIHDLFYKGGWDTGDLANKFGMSVRLVRKILRKENIPARMTRAQVLKELLPGLNALFGKNYAKLEAN